MGGAPEAPGAPELGAWRDAVAAAAAERDGGAGPRGGGTAGRRTAAFWGGFARIYFGYKGAQARAAALRLRRGGAAREEALWAAHNRWAGLRMWELATELRGFYLKAGQFLGSRGDFMPKETVEVLCRLQDSVPPMRAAEVEALLLHELGLKRLSDVFEWVDLNEPLGSATIAQVHRASVRPGRLPRPWEGRMQRLLRWVRAAGRGGEVIALKIQNPHQRARVDQDLRNLRRAARFIQDFELKFDLTSVVDELAAQVSLEFDFAREAWVQDRVGERLRPLGVRVPRSIPALSTPRLLAMEFLDGVPLTKAMDHPSLRSMPASAQFKFKQRLLEQISEAYGSMILGEDGLFQADPHPGNLMLMRGGRLGLLDFGQSKTLDQEEQRRLAAVVLALASGRQGEEGERAIMDALFRLGVIFERPDPGTCAEAGVHLFDTRGALPDPFSPDSPLRSNAITTFPRDMFFVMRVVQLLRGLKAHMEVPDGFSSADQWSRLARHHV